MGKVAQALSGLAAAVAANPRAQRAAETWSAVVQFEVAGERQPLHLIVSQGKLTAGEGQHVKPDFVVAGQGTALIRVLSGEVDITHPIAQGDLRVVRGSYIELINLSRIALAARARR
ncbi:MAG: SCP2 sterol-binding domain-containing protein [Dehalococcoidia bacterium]|nr:SCP2 sterol-binding domain-containing protein [Dehalococcoidia bacterium]